MSEVSEVEREAAQRAVDLERNSALGNIQAGISAEGSDFCIDCDDPIEIKRREVAPFAKRCITCQEIMELR